MQITEGEKTLEKQQYLYENGLFSRLFLISIVVYYYYYSNKNNCRDPEL